MTHINMKKGCAYLMCVALICLGSCKKENPNCVWCYPDENSPYWTLYNREMVCNPDPMGLQQEIAAKEAEGWDCDEP